jgi:hypothetical protein
MTTDPLLPDPLSLGRRAFLRACPVGLGAFALQQLFAEEARGEEELRILDHAARAKNVIFLFMAGGPSQLELFDYKEALQKYSGQTVPASFTENNRFAFIGKDAKLMGTKRRFARHGESGSYVSELLPHTAKIVDRICILRGMRTDIINHGPAKLFVNTGSPQFGRPSMGAWVLYGIGSEARDLPGFVVLQSGPRGPRGGAPLWGSGFLPTRYQGVPFRSKGDPILHLENPPGIDEGRQREFHDAVRDLNQAYYEEVRDPEIETRTAAYEMAFRMQASAPELMDLSAETAATWKLYGIEDAAPSFARNCLLARRMVERGVRFIQLYHTDWDHHGDPNLHLEAPLEEICREVDQASAALVLDLQQRGLLDETLVVWGGEFGRTPMSEIRKQVGRDHHIDAYTMWVAGGGVKAGYHHGVTDELGYSVADGAIHVHDLQATILHLLGRDHKRLTYRFHGRDFRLTDVHGEVIHDLIA